MDTVRAVRDGPSVQVGHYGEGLSLTDGRETVALRGRKLRSTDLARFPEALRLYLVRNGSIIATVRPQPNPRA